MNKCDNFLLILVDSGLVYFSYLSAYLLINTSGDNFIIWYILLMIPLTVFIFYRFNIYNYIWEYVGFSEAYYIIFAFLVSFLVMCIITILFNLHLMINVLILYHMILFIVFIFGRLFLYNRIKIIHKNDKATRTLIIGANNLGSLIIQELIRNKFYNIICVVDRDVKKSGKYIHGIKIVGTIKDLNYIVYRYNIETIIVADDGYCSFLGK